MPCATDNDMQCPFGRCVGGRCGGCRSNEDCKPGSGCYSTPLGPSCMPTGQPGPSTPPVATTPPATTSPPATTPPPTTPPPASATYAQERAQCVNGINQYRASKGLPALSPRSDFESCADGSAASDSASQTPHGAFGKCQEAAQNECPGWQGTLGQVIDGCTKAMFAEGPGDGPAHGHYRNMMDPGYRSVACGIHVGADGKAWVVHNFYR
ncbi:MAG: CAP domain-containing protein [Polyangiaceae bacterium]